MRKCRKSPFLHFMKSMSYFQRLNHQLKPGPFLKTENPFHELQDLFSKTFKVLTPTQTWPFSQNTLTGTDLNYQQKPTEIYSSDLIFQFKQKCFDQKNSSFYINMFKSFIGSTGLSSLIGLSYLRGLSVKHYHLSSLNRLNRFIKSMRFNNFTLTGLSAKATTTWTSSAQRRGSQTSMSR